MKAIVKYSVLNLFVAASNSSFAGNTEEDHSVGLTEYPLNSFNEAAAGICFQHQVIKSTSELFNYN